MGIFIWCEVVCSQCARTLPGEFTTKAIPRRALTVAVHAAEWLIEGNEVFCSRKCQDRHNRRASPTSGKS